MGILQNLGLVRASTTTIATDETKAMTGPGAYAMQDGSFTSWFGSMGRWDTPKGMVRAQALSHANPWIEKSERLICGRLASMPWHLETGDDETIDDESPPALKAIRNLLERPSPFTRPEVTWRDLVHITARHMGVINVGAWYLDSLDVDLIPKEILYLNPARLTPAEDSRRGWYLDKGADYGNAGTFLDHEEVIVFTLVPPDQGWAGSGLVEVAETKANLSKYADRFATQTYATGGRRGSWISPRDGRMPDDVFDALVAGLKNIADSPDATKRNIVSKGAIDVTPQASTPQELQAADIMAMSRDDLLVIWGVDVADAGIPGGAGLSSGQLRSQARQSTYENAIEPRLDVLEEKIQFRLLDRFKALGITVELEIERPEWEDETPAYERAAKVIQLPMRNRERRAILGLDPFGDPALDEAVWLPAGIYEAYMAPDATGQTPAVTVSAAPVPQITEGKASLSTTRQAVDARITPKMRRDVAKVLADFGAETARLAKEKAAHLVAKPSDVRAVFNETAFKAALAKALTPHQRATVATVAGVTKQKLGHLNPAKAEPPTFLEDVTTFVLRRGGERIVEMADTTRDAIVGAIKDVVTVGAQQGLGPADIADRLTDAVGALPAWSDARAETIARTETMFAYNDAALGSYREYGVDRVEAIDGDGDPECADRDGQTFTLDEALGITDHPNGTLDWLPVIKATLDEPHAPAGLTQNFILGTEQAVKAMVPQDVHVDAPDFAPLAAALLALGDRIAAIPANTVTVPAPQVTNIVEAPVVNVPEQKAGLPQDIRIVSMPDRQTKKAVRRDTDGNILDVGEFTTDG